VEALHVEEKETELQELPWHLLELVPRKGKDGGPHGCTGKNMHLNAGS
jgi:hypothetical protein